MPYIIIFKMVYYLLKLVKNWIFYEFLKFNSVLVSTNVRENSLKCPRNNQKCTAKVPTANILDREYSGIPLYSTRVVLWTTRPMSNSAHLKVGPLQTRPTKLKLRYLSYSWMDFYETKTSIITRR